MPFVDQVPLFNFISNSPKPWIHPWAGGIWNAAIPAFVCPSSPPCSPHAGALNVGPRSYRFSMGDTIVNTINAGSSTVFNTRGMFGTYSRTSAREVTDGLSNTIALSERELGGEGQTGTNKQKLGRTAKSITNSSTPSNCLVTAVGTTYSGSVVNWPAGMMWPSGMPYYAGFNTALPPNSPSCSSSTDDEFWGVYSATSMHSGGVNVLMGDGAIRFVSENIDAGTPSSTEVTSGVSPYGVWGALGSKSGSEVIGDF